MCCKEHNANRCAYLWQKSFKVKALNSVHCACVQEEVSHCAAGVKWLTYLFEQAQQQQQQQQTLAAEADKACDPRRFADVQSWFHALVRNHFVGDLKVTGPVYCLH